MKKRLLYALPMLCVLLIAMVLMTGASYAVSAAETEPAEACLVFNGLSVRLEERAGIRAEYTLHTDAVRHLEENGYRVEAGVLLNATRTDIPTLENAEHRFVLWENGAVNESMVIARDGEALTAAVAVLFTNPTAKMAMDPVQYNGYLLLTDAQGETSTLYVNSIPTVCQNNLIALYSHLEENDRRNDAFVQKVVSACYDRVEINIDGEQGSDEADGIHAPVKTLKRAYEVMLEQLQCDVAIDITLRFADGSHFNGELLELDSKNFGQKYYRLHYVGEGEATLTSNLKMDASKFQPVEGEEYYSYQFEQDAQGKYPDFRYLYVNGSIATIAHRGYTRVYDSEVATGTLEYKNLMYKNRYELFCDPNGVKNTENGYKLYLPAELFEDLEPEDFAQMEYHAPLGFYYRMMHVSHVDLTDTTENAQDGKTYAAMYFNPDEAKDWFGLFGVKDYYFWLQNSLAFLDEPGEYYYDRQKGTLYYFPAEDVDMEDATFEYPTTEYFLAFIDCVNVSFESINFTGIDCYEMQDRWWPSGQADTARGQYGLNTVSAVYMRNPKNFTFLDCEFHDIGATAIKAAGRMNNITVDSCSFTHIGATALDLCNRNGVWNETKNAVYDLQIVNNSFYDIAWNLRNAVALLVGVVQNLDISYNTFSHTSYTAISVGWKWEPSTWEFGEDWHVYNAEIYCNYIESFMTDLSDGGAIYTLGGNATIQYSEYFNYIHDNYVWYTEHTWDGQGMVMPYYHDGGSTHWHTYGNVEILYPGRTVHTPIFLQCSWTQASHNILVEENHIVGAFKTWVQYRDHYDWTAMEQERIIFGMNTDYPPSEQPDGLYTCPTRVDMDRNLYQKNNFLYDHPAEISDEMKMIMSSAGSSLMLPDVDAMIEEMEQVYSRYYQLLEEAYENS